MTYDSHKARKLRRAVLATVANITMTAPSNIKRFLLLKRRLEKDIARFEEYTGRMTLGEEEDLVTYGGTKT